MRSIASLTAAPLSGATSETPVMPRTVALSATTGAPGRSCCQSRIAAPEPTGAMASPSSRWAAIFRTCSASRSSEYDESSTSSVASASVATSSAPLMMSRKNGLARFLATRP